MPVKKIYHDLKSETILKCLWALRDSNEFYFKAYGEDFIAQYVKQELAKAQRAKPNDIKKFRERKRIGHCRRRGFETPKLGLPTKVD